MPLAYSCWQWVRGRRDARLAASDWAAWDWRLTIKSTLAFALAFNLIFFIQELFLVLPKALTPGLEPTLFHNNHNWRGHHPVEDLLQGTGALATVIAGAIFSVWLIRRTPKGDVTRLVLFWLALLGFLSALPQVVIGTVIVQNDVGRAMSYLHFTPAARLLASIGAFIAMALACWRLTPYLLSVADVEGPRAARHGSGSYRRSALYSRHSPDCRLPHSKLRDRSIASASRGRIDSVRVDTGGGMARPPHRCRPAAIRAALLAAHPARLPARPFSAGAEARNRFLLTARYAEIQRHRIHAVAQAGRIRPVIEHVAQVRVATFAVHLGARLAACCSRTR